MYMYMYVLIRHQTLFFVITCTVHVVYDHLGVCTCRCTCIYMYMHVHYFRDCLRCAVLLCLVCLFDLACFFLSSFSSLIKTCTCTCTLFSAVTIHKFVRDKYSLRFPELESLVPTPLEYIRTIQVNVVNIM